MMELSGLSRSYRPVLYRGGGMPNWGILEITPVEVNEGLGYGGGGLFSANSKINEC